MDDTPLVVVGLPAVERHVARLQSYCNHACGVINLHDNVAVDAGDGTATLYAVQARGRTA